MTDQQRAREIAERTALLVEQHTATPLIAYRDELEEAITTALAAVRAEDKGRIETLEQALREIAGDDPPKGQQTGPMRTYQMRAVARAALGGPR